MTDYATGAEDMRKACLARLGRIAEEKAAKELEYRKTSQHGLEVERMIERLAYNAAMVEVEQVILVPQWAIASYRARDLIGPRDQEES